MCFHNKPSILLMLCLSFLIISSSTAQPPPPPYNPYDSPPPFASASVDTFDFVNAGPFPPYRRGDYGSTFRELERSASDFTMSLCFYNTTPNAYTLALGVDPSYFVWAANPSDPVKEGAKLSLKDDGNLVLVDVDGRLVWQSNTSNMGVIGVQSLIYGQYGNMVLYDAHNNTVWQSFDHPTDTIFPNQFLRATGPKKLVSRVSSLGGVYSLVLMPNRVSLYYKSANSSNPVVYYTMFKTTKTLSTLQFLAYDEFKPSFNQQFTDGTQDRYEIGDLTPPADYHYEIITSFMRLQNDGNLKVIIYQINDEGDQGWFPGFSVFKEDYAPLLTHQVDSCLLPEKCGAFGVCQNSTCVACPSPQGLLPWTAGKCVPPKLGACSLRKAAKYYKVQGVEHFSSMYNKGEGPMALALCQSKCSLDCKCVGYFYHLENSRCWIAYDLMTLTKSGNPKHFGFIKTSN
ncbi:EP1-like glycoprotein 4 [Silene latifolia]|uniref:EP1-like glycoprotein 4 n=1 Tax=Silene latifolia TaxID=37657 RepID=UPI003D775159